MAAGSEGWPRLSESIGGRSEMAAPGLGEDIRCIVVPEVGGLAHLPDDHGDLAAT